MSANFFHQESETVAKTRFCLHQSAGSLLHIVGDYLENSTIRQKKTISL